MRERVDTREIDKIGTVRYGKGGGVVVVVLSCGACLLDPNTE